MGEFFKGWRRKAGLVTLAMACLLMVGWMRSLVKCDALWFVVGNRQQMMWSMDSCIAWESDPVDSKEFWEMRTYDRSDSGYAALCWEVREEVDSPMWKVPYWSLILLLTLLSAWLIFAKPRKSKLATGSAP